MLPDFTERAAPAELPEWMDGPCSYEEFRDCLLDIDASNRWSLGFRPTLAWLNALPRQKEPLRILDVGFGSGWMLRRIARWARRRRVAVELSGIDLNPYAARAAEAFNQTRLPIRFLTGNAFAMDMGQEVDVILSSLMAHHLEAPELIAFLRWMEATARHGWFVNDLYRGAAPYCAFQTLARVARFHRFVRHDGPVSIRRSFREGDWRSLCAGAGVENATIQRWFPGRLCVGRVR